MRRMKKLRVNSILDSDVRRIRKPCEARAGHGLLMFLVAMTVLGGLLWLVVTLLKKIF